MENFTLIRDAKVEVRAISVATSPTAKTRAMAAEITIGDQFQHRFKPTSRVSKHLEVMSTQDLQDRLTGGSFFFIGDEMVDFRDGSYNGFIHDDESIKVFTDLLGYTHRAALPLHRRKVRNTGDSSDILLRKVWNKNEISVPGYRDGGNFSSELSFKWNPFAKTIDSAFDLIRLICENGAVGMTSFLNTKIPLLNRWEEHLDIASRQIQNKVNRVVVERIGAMSSERASVGDCLLLESHAHDRLFGARQQLDIGEDAQPRLLNLMHAASPSRHLGHIYASRVFGERQLASQLPSHLSALDVYNIATEIRSHTEQSPKSSDAGLDRLANGLLFDRNDNAITARSSQYTAPALSSFADAERAFYSDMQ